MLDLFAAAGSAASQPPAWTSWILPLGMLLILWFLILRPQMRQQKEHRERVEKLKKGDEVVTAGGLVGRIVKVEEHFVQVELAKGMTVKAVRNTIGEVLNARGTAAAND
ncbi:MAG: preprotein translocase subunit YajC [Erythrobacter sp.]|jgi:preprotein translocase subunit YajC